MCSEGGAVELFPLDVPTRLYQILNVLEQRHWVATLDDEEDCPDMQNVKHALVFFGDRLEGVQFDELGVWWDVGAVWEGLRVHVEAGDGPVWSLQRESESPDTIIDTVSRALWP